MNNRLAFLVFVVVALAAFVVVRSRGPRDILMEPPPARAPLPSASAGSGPATITAPVEDRVILSTSDLAAQRAVIRSLPDDLSAAEVDRLIPLLKARRTSPKIPRGYTLALQNDLLLALRRQKSPPPHLPEILVEILRDRTFDVGLRDYAVQHLASWYEEITLPSGPAAQTQEARRELVAIFIEALGEVDTSIAGTALLSLHRLAAADPAIPLPPAFVLETAVRFVTDPAVGDLSRITAIQICAERGQSEVLPAVAGLAGSRASLPLRLSALSALGALGKPEHREILASLAAGPPSTLARAAAAALHRFDARSASAASPSRI